MTVKTVCDRKKLYVTDTNWLLQTQTVCDSKKLSMTVKYCMWQTQTDFDRHRLSVTDTDCLLQKHTVYDRYRLFVTDIDCLSRTQIVCDRYRLYKALCLLSVQMHTIFKTGILNISKCVSISKLGKYYCHIQSKAFCQTPDLPIPKSSHPLKNLEGSIFG